VNDRTCRRCGMNKPSDRFREMTTRRGTYRWTGRKTICRTCESRQRCAWKRQNRGKANEQKRRNRANKRAREGRIVGGYGKWWQHLGRGYGLAIRDRAAVLPPARLPKARWVERLRRERPDRYDPTLLPDTLVYRARYLLDPEFRAKEIARREQRKAQYAGREWRADGTLTPRVVANLFSSAKTCAYCGSCLRPRDKTLDHVVPTSKGGMHSLANVVICCRSCNSRKHTRTPAEWLGQPDRGAAA